MSSGAVRVDDPVLTPEQRRAFLELVAAEPGLGNAHALRRVGVQGSKPQLQSLIDEELLEEARLARGHDIQAVEDVRWKIALDPTHKDCEKAGYSLLTMYHPGWRQAAKDMKAANHTPQLAPGLQVNFALMTAEERNELIATLGSDPAVVELLPESYRVRVLELAAASSGGETVEEGGA